MLSLLTAVDPQRDAFLSALVPTIAAQQVPPGWEIEWVLQEDAAAPRKAPPTVAGVTTVCHHNGARMGPAVTRNLAAANSRGQLLRTVDADDMLLPGALQRDIEAMEMQPDLAWLTSAALDVELDGSVTAFASPQPEGPVAVGAVIAYWESHGQVPPVHPATLTIRRSRLFEIGGWMALPGATDTGMLIALNTLHAGWFISTPSLLYRHWPDQITRSRWYNDPSVREARARFIRERAQALSRGAD